MGDVMSVAITQCLHNLYENLSRIFLRKIAIRIQAIKQLSTLTKAT